MNTWFPLVGRVLLVILFFNSGINKLLDPDPVTAKIGESGLPLPAFFTWFSIFAELVGATMILVGYKTRFAAWLLIFWLLPVTLIMHPMSDPKQKGAWQKNFAIIGGLVFLSRSSPGKWAIEPGKG